MLSSCRHIQDMSKGAGSETNQGIDYAAGAIGGSIVLGGGAVIGGLLNSRKALRQEIKNLF